MEKKCLHCTYQGLQHYKKHIVCPMILKLVHQSCTSNMHLQVDEGKKLAKQMHVM